MRLTYWLLPATSALLLGLTTMGCSQHEGSSATTREAAKEETAAQSAAESSTESARAEERWASETSHSLEPRKANPPATTTERTAEDEARRDAQ